MKTGKKNLRIGIIGGGPAGSLAAYLFSRQGHSVVLFEKADKTSRKLCGEYLCPTGVELLDALGIKKEVCEGFLPIHGMVLGSPAGRVVRCDFPGRGIAQGISVNRQLFDRRLLDLALSAGAVFRPGTPVQSIEKSSSTWNVISGSQEASEFDLLIAADGRQSFVSKTLGHGKKLDTSRVAIHFYLPKRTERELRYGEMHIFQDGTYCGINPIGPEEANVSFVIDAQKLKKKNLHELCNQYLQESSRLKAMFAEIPLSADVKVTTPLKNHNSWVAGNGLAYVGDASGFIDPLTGEGIYNAILSAYLLDQAIGSTADLDRALKIYKENKNKVQFQKKVLNSAFQIVIRSPFACEKIASFIEKSKNRADAFIGIVGNVYSPTQGFFKMLTNTGDTV